MAGGPIFPSSGYVGTSGNIFPNFYAGGGGNISAHDEGWGVVGSLASDSTLELRFPMPPTLPTGTLKLRTLALNATNSLVANWTVFDANVAAGASPSAASLAVGEAQDSITWGASDADKYKEVKRTLTKATPAGNDMLVVAVKFQTTGWTQTGVTTFIFSIIWE